MDSERDQLESTLRDLRTRYAAYQRSVRRIRAIIVLSGTLFTLLIFSIVMRFATGDWVAGVFFAGLMCAIMIARLLLPSGAAWKDVLTSAIFGKGPVNAVGPGLASAQSTGACDPESH